MRARRTALSAAMAAALTLGTVGMSGVALARDGGPGRSQSVTARQAVLTDAQKAAVLAARRAYIETVWPALVRYKDAVEAAHDEMDATLRQARRALLIASDAYWFAVRHTSDASAERAALDAAATAYRQARDQAKTTLRSRLDAAKAELRTATDAAKTQYVAAVRAAFPAGAEVPAALLVPPGKPWMNGHRGWKDVEFGLRSLLGNDGRDDRGRDDRGKRR